MAQTDLAYEIVPVRVDNRTVSHAKASCRGCSATLDISLAHSMPPEHIAKKIRAKGWEFDLRNAGRTICPACQADAVRRRQPKIAPKEKVEMTNVTPISPTMREPTPEERQRVRGLLDAQFDDAKGVYLDGYSDKLVGDECNVPMLVVQRIRDAAYGPLRQVPELDLLKAEAAELKAKLAELEKKLGEIATKLGVAA